jgi:hypothetical protein
MIMKAKRRKRVELMIRVVIPPGVSMKLLGSTVITHNISSYLIGVILMSENSLE